MKVFSQSRGIHRGKNHFKQAPNVVLRQSGILGKIKAIIPSESNATIHRAYINTTQYKWKTYTDSSTSIRLAITPNIKYRIKWEDYRSFYRIGFAKTATNPSSSGVDIYKADGTSGVELITTGSDTPEYEFTITDKTIKYIVIQFSGTSTAWENNDLTTLWDTAKRLCIYEYSD